MIEVTAHPRGTVVGVRAQPGAKKNSILGERAGALRVAVTAPPERGRANDAMIDVLAASLDLKRSQISLVSGETSRDKRLLVEGIAPDDLKARIDGLFVCPPPRS